MQRSAVKRLAHSRWAVAVAVAGCVAAGYFLRGSVPRPGDIAAAAELTSMLMFALQQRRLLRAFGGSMTVRDGLLVTFARTGISVALPAGAAVSAAFALRHCRQRVRARQVRRR